MKMTALITLLVVSGLSTVMAEGRLHKGPDLEPIIHQLQLDPRQAEQLQAAVLKHRQQHKALRQQFREKRTLMHEKRQAMREAHKQDLLKIMNEAQAQAFFDYVKQQRQQRRAARQQGSHQIRK